MLGPLPPAVGGMTTVLELLRRSSLASRFELHAQDTAQATGPWRLLRSPMRHARRALTLHRSLCDHAVDVVHIHTCSGFSFFRNLVDAAQARRAGAAVVLHVHGASFDAFCRDAGATARRAIRRGLEAADRVMVLSKSWQKALEPFAPNACFAVVPNGVPVPHESWRAETRPNNGDTCRFLFIGSMDRRKGIDILLAAARRLTRKHVRFHLTLAGPLSEAESTRLLHSALAQPELAAAVSYVGPVDIDARQQLLRATDCLVLPSRAEGLPMTLLEAGAAGVPAIATRVGAVSDVIEHESTGLLCEPGDPGALADAMLRAATDRAVRVCWGERLFQSVRTSYSIDVQADAITDVYDNVLRERDRGAAVAMPALRAEPTHG